MSQPTTTKQRGFRSLRPSIALLLAAVIVYFSVWGYEAVTAYYQAYQAREQARPRLTLKTWLKDFRAFHKVTGRFPLHLAEFDRIIWQPRRRGKVALAVEQVGASSSLRLHNYAYLYTQIGPAACALWALPLGPRRHETQTVFLFLTPTETQLWRGAALASEDIFSLTAFVKPTREQLTNLGLIEQSDNAQATSF